MSFFIQERRQNIIEENNTAQEYLLDFLENLHPSLTEIVFKEPLSGDIDFSILKECNFTNITSIRFPIGNITRVTNLPETIVSFECPQNLLIELIGLPKSLIILEIPDNGLKSLDFKELPNLKTLNISQNQFNELRGLPSTLETLYCNNNKIKEIDLEGLDNLKVLHCKNNSMLAISHFSNSITDLKMDNNPYLEMNEESINNETTQSIAVTEAIHEFFKLKNEYETYRHKLKKDTFKKSATKLGAKKRINALRFKCINCKSPGSPEGTLFSMKDRIFTAICGAQNRCNLNIRIFSGNFSDLYDYYRLFKEDVESNKENIIKHKLDTLFNYTNERQAIELFKEEMKSYSFNNILLKELLNTNNHLHNNEERIAKIAEKKAIIDEINANIEKLLKEYKSTENREILNIMMTTHINELLPETRNLRYLLFELTEIETIEKHREDIHVLVQKTNQLQKIDYTFNNPAKVMNFEKK
jgi:transcription elongation factor Elf1